MWSHFYQISPFICRTHLSHCHTSMGKIMVLEVQHGKIIRISKIPQGRGVESFSPKFPRFHVERLSLTVKPPWGKKHGFRSTTRENNSNFMNSPRERCGVIFNNLPVYTKNTSFSLSRLHGGNHGFRSAKRENNSKLRILKG